MILLILLLCDDVIKLATEFLNFPKFDQTVMQFDFLALINSLFRFFTLRFISFVIRGRLRLDLVVL